MIKTKELKIIEKYLKKLLSFIKINFKVFSVEKNTKNGAVINP